jgi:plasmid stabilization system protein ParE
MPESYRVIISPAAFDDLEQALDYVAKDSPANAVKLVGRLMAEIDSLEVFPRRYSRRHDPNDPSVELHSMPSPPFRIVYEVIESQHAVRVLAVEHGSRESRRR